MSLITQFTVQKNLRTIINLLFILFDGIPYSTSYEDDIFLNIIHLINYQIEGVIPGINTYFTNINNFYSKPAPSGPSANEFKRDFFIHLVHQVHQKIWNLLVKLQPHQAQRPLGEEYP